KTNQFAARNVLARIDAMSAELREAQDRNFKRWRILGQHVWPNWYVGRTFDEEVNWMKQWIMQRLDWIDRQFLAPPTARDVIAHDANEEKNPGRTVVLRATKGEIYYSVDGTDPRAPGGAPSPQAQRYRDPIPRDAGAKITARAHTASAWSAPL